MSYREYMLARLGHRRQRNFDFEHTRAVVYAIARTNWDPKKSFPTIEQFWNLETDPVPSPTKQSAEMAALKKQMDLAVKSFENAPKFTGK